MADLPKTLSEIDADWLTEQLSIEGHDVDVAELDMRPLDGFVGRMGEVALANVHYTSPTDLPTTFIAKCPLDDEVAQLMNSVMSSYKREHGFYRDLSQRVPVPVPASFVNLYDPETDRAVLFIERIDGTPGDIQAGCSLEEMETLLRMLAHVHGRFWMDDELAAMDWVYDWASPLWEMGIPMVEHHWPELTNAWPDLVSDELSAVLDRRWTSDIRAGLAELYDRPWTLAHNDYQLDNVIFGDDGPTIIDWQTVMRSSPGIDVGWLLATAETPHTVAEERALLDAYRSELARSGGPAWTHDELVDDMCHAMLYFITGLSIPVDQQRHTHEKGDRERDRLEQFLTGCISSATRWRITERLS